MSATTVYVAAHCGQTTLEGENIPAGVLAATHVEKMGAAKDLHAGENPVASAHLRNVGPHRPLSRVEEMVQK